MFRRLVLASVSAVALSAAANAADIYVPGPAGGYKDFEPAPIWAGFYVGVNGGWAWGTEQDVSLLQCGSTCVSGSASHTSDGGQIGYNIQRDRLVFGLEADIQGAGLDGGAIVTPDLTPAKAESNLDWFGTVRGRLGLTFPDPAGLIYITGGFAYGGIQHKLTGSAPIVSVSDDHVGTGWVLGAGYERFVTQALSLKVEYQFIDLGSDHLHSISKIGFFEANGAFFDNFSTVRAGLNYHIGAVYEPLK